MESLRAENRPLLVAQSSAVDPSTAVDTGQAVPNVRGLPDDSSLQTATSEQQVEEIKTIQQELQNRGYYNGPIDGIYGPGTAEAIRTLRGQAEDPVNPGLLTPDTAPADGLPETGNAGSQTEGDWATEQPSEGGDPEASDGSSVRLNPTDPLPEEINIGDSVSPGTGVEPAATETAPAASDAQTDGQTDAQAAEEPPSSGGGLLWPGIAIIAALGSFGIGFVLAKRAKGRNDELESPWGAVPAEVPQQEHAAHHPSAQSALNGYSAANGTASDQAAEHVTPSNHRLNDSLPTLSAANPIGETTPTTRLAKVDVMDELVANLQVADPTKRRKAIWELGQRGNSSAVQHLVNTMVDADSKEKSLILAALSEIGIRSLKPMNRALAIALQDDNPDVRKNAIRDLTRVYDLVTQISQMLGHATEDEDPEVRRTAEWALGQLNRIREAPKLKSSLNTLDASRSPSELLPDEVKNLKN
ncbi:HEAT repeat domain-containing protein [Leptolyngbya cf. ectocarpi LEGE 11479]|uniref:HEAT repeat domain-containing protein n=1 Tax=Leptolyngbya cf. ectocarpi LEGE 11479 TaxID=1828722 RepID=A0A928ZX00_LEPEC|nr:HEAT repeat domain-containing protein [Leptolyngbya ectocarpi]MBE9069047.1 HEAT repeat domain-containing protein [Leptolyngbya cf. ectocarpi LEGE 11479]